MISLDFGKFQFTTLHKGMKNADQYIQEMFEQILFAIDRNSIKIRLGEILVHSTDFYEHMEIIKKIFWSFRDARIKVSLCVNFETDELSSSF